MKNSKFYLSFILIILLFVVSCQNSKETEIVVESDIPAELFNDGILGNINGGVELEILARFDECGEGGGHEEKFRIYRVNNKDLFIDFLLDTVKCNPFYSLFPKFVKLKTIKLTKKEESLIVSNLSILLKNSLKNQFLYSQYHHAIVYSTVFSDTTMLIQTGGYFQGDCEKAFRKLKSELNINTEKGRINPS